MRIGVRAHDFGKGTAEELAKKIEEKNASCIQLALAKAISGLNTAPGTLNPGLAHYLRETFGRHQIQIAVLGCYINPIHPDPVARRKALERFKEHLRFARDFGCSIVGTETGTLTADFSYHPDTHSAKGFQSILESVTELVAEAEKFGVFVGIEGVTKHSVSTPEKMGQVLKTIKSSNLQVIFDPCNFLSEENYERQDEIIKQSFDLFGDRIQILHAKDFLIENGKKKIVPIGEGLLHYELLLSLIKKHKPHLEILLEAVKPENVERIQRYLVGIYEKV